MSSIYNRYPRCHYKEVTKGHFTEKRGFISKEEASLFIKKRGLKHFDAYKCPVCPFWHIGHNPNYNPKDLRLREMKLEDRIAIYKGWKYRH